MRPHVVCSPSFLPGAVRQRIRRVALNLWNTCGQHVSNLRTPRMFRAARIVRRTGVDSADTLAHDRSGPKQSSVGSAPCVPLGGRAAKAGGVAAICSSQFLPRLQRRGRGNGPVRRSTPSAGAFGLRRRPTVSPDARLLGTAGTRAARGQRPPAGSPDVEAAPRVTRVPFPLRSLPV
jgi:hypothetical protein